MRYDQMSMSVSGTLPLHALHNINGSKLHVYTNHRASVKTTLLVYWQLEHFETRNVIGVTDVTFYYILYESCIIEKKSS